MFNRILVVCIGNICRSPVGEGLLKQYFPDKLISSAGICSESSKLVGTPADSQMASLAQEKGLDISQHKSRQLTKELCHSSDLILVMEREHIELVKQISPESVGKVMLYGHWLDSHKEIPDPYRKSREAFEYSYKMLEDASLTWKQKL